MKYCILIKIQKIKKNKKIIAFFIIIREFNLCLLIFILKKIGEFQKKKNVTFDSTKKSSESADLFKIKI